MKTLWGCMFLVFLPASTLAIVSINDTALYKPCIPYSSAAACPSEDQQCFQYFCYPRTGAQDPLKSCKKNSDCNDVYGAPKCSKQSRVGICVSRDDYERCYTNEECEGRGGKCCADYCCNEEYFQALQEIPCEEDDGECQVRQ